MLIGLQRYYYSIGLPNLGNTCYLNSLLQALSGCFTFTDYLDRVLKSITLNCEDPNEIKIFLFIKTIKEL
jgi:ubiquitin C-terminal hydrolase